MIQKIKPPVLGPAAAWATAEHQAYKELPIKSRAAILIVWRAAAALNAKFRLRNDDDVDVIIEGDPLTVSQQKFPAEVQPTEDEAPRDEQCAAGMLSVATSAASVRTTGGDVAANAPGKGSAMAHPSSGKDAASLRLRVLPAGAPELAKEVRLDPCPKKLVRPKGKPTPSPVASGGGASAFVTTLFAAIAVCCMLGYVLRYFDKSASSISTDAVSNGGDAERTTNRPHARQRVNASESRRDQQR